MKKQALCTALVVAVFAFSACDKKDEAKSDDPAKNPTTTNATATAATNATTTAGTNTAAPAPAAVTIAESDLYTQADFDEVAQKAITTKNYKQELASLETDIAKD